mgnify:CR=1 FL=1
MTRHMSAIAETILAHRGQAVALRLEGATLSWDQLRTAVTAAEAWLNAQVAAPGPVALIRTNSLANIVAFLAALRQGRAVQVLDPDWPHAMRRDVLKALKPVCVIDDATDVAAWFDAAPVSDLAPGVEDPDSTFYVGFTSGSLGTPKGFQRDQRSWQASFDGDQTLFGFAASNTFVIPGNLVHSLFMYAALRGLYAGAETILFRSFQPRRVIDCLRTAKNAVVFGTPTQFDALVRAVDPQTFGGVRLALGAGSAMSDALQADLARVFKNAEIATFYGTSELSYVSVAKYGVAPAGSVGTPFPGVEIEIRDAAGACVPTGEVGRVFVRSKLQFQGYAGDTYPAPEQINGALSVGDAGYLDGPGNLYLVGRVDRMINSAGKNIFPEEVEAVLGAHPRVQRAAVFGVEDARRGQRLVAAIKCADMGAVEDSTLIAWAREHLPLYKVPMRYVMLADWPVTAADKTDFSALHARMKADT